MMNTMLNRVRRALSPMGLSARVLISVVLAGAIVSACDVHGITAPGILASMTVTPDATLTVGATQQMTAVGYDADGRVVPVSPTWTVAAGGGTIASTGIFTAGATPGLFAHTVVASVGSISANASITVIPGALATIVVTPNPVTLAVMSTQQFIAVGKDAAGNIVQFTPTWSVVAGGGSVDQGGIFTAGATIGTYANTVQASSQSLKGFATVNVTVGPLASITVTPNPDTLIVGAKQQFTAVGKDVSGNTVVLAAVWSVVANGGTVDGGGVFTAGATPGTFTNTIKATSGALSGTATVVVTAGPLAIIKVTPNPATLTLNAAQQFTAVGTDIAGNPVAITTPTWAVVASGGTINATGLFTAGTVSGTFTNTIRATSGALSGFATVIVTSGPLANITVTPNPVFMPTNSLQQFLAVGKDASGNVFVMKPVWSVVNGGGVIDTLGNFTSGAVAGSFVNTIQASSGAISGFATVNVATGALATITVSPNPSNLIINGTQTFTAVGKDVNGNIVGIVPAWSVVNATAGIINGGTGLFTAGTVPGAYTNTVKATSGAISGFATVNVAVGPLFSITVSPNPSNLSTGGTQPFTAVGKDAGGNVLVIVPFWSVVNPTAGGINSGTGFFTAGAVAGTYTNTVQATSGAVSGFATVIIAAPSLVNLGAATSAGIFANQSVSCSSAGTINADVMVSPGITVTGFGAGNCTLTGTEHLNDGVAQQALIDATNAYNTLMGLPCTANIVADLGSTTLTPGVYCTNSTIQVTGHGSLAGLTLDAQNNPNATFVFLAKTITGAMTTAGDINLKNQAQAKNVYWVIGTSATLGTASLFQGNILAAQSITMVDTSTLIGRALALGASVTLGTGNVITLP